MALKKVREIAHSFVIDELADFDPTVKPMFGCHAVYIEDKIVFILRRRDSFPNDNGVWIATTGEHHASLKKEFKNMRSIEAFGPGPTGWQVLPENGKNFEDSVLKAIELVKAADPRIGKIPKSRVSRSKAKLKKRKR